MTFYSDMADTALDLIDEFGKLLTFTRTSKTRSSDTGVVTRTPTEYTAFGVKTQFDKSELESIEEGDIKIVVEAGDYDIDDTVSIDAIDYRIYRVNPVTPASTNICNFLYCRK